ncbi:hypothetical protein [Streptomyces exfoliatus]|uniref:hypothetical protein n=1 Tax=Streptomyces exfoliatus TaxID=1905 RepID=UPI003C2C5E87
MNPRDLPPFKVSLENWLDEIAFELLKNLPKWRLRAIERIELSSERWSIRTREIHVESLVKADLPYLQTLLRDFPRECDQRVRIFLPVTRMSKHPLLDFHVTVDDQEVFRLSRQEGARVQARYFKRLADDAGVAFGSQDLPCILTAIFGSTAPSVRKFNLDKYLQKEFGPEGLPCSKQAFKGVESEIRRVTGEWVLSETGSSAENPLLSLAQLVRVLRDEHKSPMSDSSMAALIHDLGYFLRKVSAIESPQRDALLRTYAEYGWYWEAFAYCSVPLDRPFMIKVTAKREIHFSEPGGGGRDSRSEVWTRVAFLDANSNHVNIRVPDINVELKEKACEVRGPKNTELNFIPDRQDRTSDLYSIYSDKSERDDLLCVKTRLKLTFLIWLVYGIVFSASVLAIGVGVWGAVAGRSFSPAVLALLLAPTTFVAALLLVRESSPLSAKLSKRPRVLLGVVLIVLWSGAVTLFACGKVTNRNPPSQVTCKITDKITNVRCTVR